ncbi:MAG: tetratricopeptide repeat protein [Deltaproteobacteria bacterium]|nr:tetratricopeptide repeat protein [Deltaproteobacteria bacterium]MBI3076189.1 tetratricopeptide repeat protein [Deltaproteobacteria bacterium]
MGRGTAAMAEQERTKAIELFEEAYRYQMAGELETAIQLYKESIELHPTAEAHTFLGWTYSFQGRLDDAIHECLRAIEVDPSLGNPYNDIGVYLVQQRKDEEAIPWLERAKGAPRYEPRHFPYLNLGQIYRRKGQFLRAIQEFERAIELNPGDKLATRSLAEVRALLN